MEINIYQMIEGAKKARGLTVIIDVFRAFTVEAYLFNGGADKIIPVGNAEVAYDLKEKNKNFVILCFYIGYICTVKDFNTFFSKKLFSKNSKNMRIKLYLVTLIFFGFCPDSFKPV